MHPPPSLLNKDYEDIDHIPLLPYHKMSSHHLEFGVSHSHVFLCSLTTSVYICNHWSVFAYFQILCKRCNSVCMFLQFYVCEIHSD